MRRALAILALTATLVALLAGSAGAATPVTAKAQLRGHLPELGESPTMRVFVTQAAYDTYRNSLGDANVFPAASSLFMSFDKEILALYTRGNDTGGRCIGTQIVSGFSGTRSPRRLRGRPAPAGRRARPITRSSSSRSPGPRPTGPRGYPARGPSSPPSRHRTRTASR